MDFYITKFHKRVMSELTIKGLFPKDGKFTFLVGAGCSMDPPSCLPAGKQMMNAIIEHSCAESEIKKIQNLGTLRFEQLVEIVRDSLDPDLKLIEYYGLCEAPNSIHLFLADMMKKGHFVMTTNFDYLIEFALLQLGVKKNRIIPVITEQDYINYADPAQKESYFVYKIHGSPPSSVFRGIFFQDTKNSLIATIQAFGSGKEGESVFQLEPHKRPVFENISRGRTLVVMGYSGSDDFDIVPTLKQLKDLTQIVWVDHASKGSIPSIYQVQNESDDLPKDKVDHILREIHQMGYGIPLFRLTIHTSDLAESVFNQKFVSSKAESCSDPKKYLLEKINTPDLFLEYRIPIRIYEKLSMGEDEERCARILLDLARREKNLSWEAASLNIIGQNFNSRGEWDNALHYYKESLVIIEKLDDPWLKANVLNNIGGLLYDKGELDAAFRYYTEVLAIVEKLETPLMKAGILNNIGLIFSDKGELDEAMRYHKQSFALADKLGALPSKMTSLNNIGSILEEKGEIDNAMHNYKESLAIAEQLGEKWLQAASLNSIGKLLAGKGEIDKALQYYKRTLAIDTQLGNLSSKASSLYNIGLLLDKKGELDEALNYYTKSLDISKNQGDLKSMAKHFNSIINLLLRKRETSKALLYYRDLVDVDDKRGNLPAKSIDFSEIGRILYDMGEMDLALRSYNEALAIDEKLGDLSLQAMRLNNIGSVLYNKGEFAEALTHLERSLKIMMDLGMASELINNTKGWIITTKEKLSN